MCQRFCMTLMLKWKQEVYLVRCHSLHVEPIWLPFWGPACMDDKFDIGCAPSFSIMSAPRMKVCAVPPSLPLWFSTLIFLQDHNRVFIRCTCTLGNILTDPCSCRHTYKIERPATLIDLSSDSVGRPHRWDALAKRHAFPPSLPHSLVVCQVKQGIAQVPHGLCIVLYCTAILSVCRAPCSYHSEMWYSVASLTQTV